MEYETYSLNKTIYGKILELLVTMTISRERNRCLGDKDRKETFYCTLFHAFCLSYYMKVIPRPTCFTSERRTC